MLFLLKRKYSFTNPVPWSLESKLPKQEKTTGNQGGPNQGGPNQGGPNQGGPNQGDPIQGGPTQRASALAALNSAFNRALSKSAPSVINCLCH